MVCLIEGEGIQSTAGLQCHLFDALRQQDQLLLELASNSATMFHPDSSKSFSDQNLLGS